MKKYFYTFILLCFYISSFSQIQKLDLNFPNHFDEDDIAFSGTIDNQYFLIGRSGSSNYSLFVSDGTEQGTFILDQSRHAPAKIFKNQLYYEKRVGLANQIFRTDGTIGSPTLFVDSVNTRSILYATTDALFFMKNNRLFYSDGTTANTYPISDAYSNTSLPRGFKKFWNKIIFYAGQEQFFIEGDSILTGDLTAAQHRLFSSGITFNGIYYFTGSDVTHGYELWRTDGTDAGTYMLKDIDPSVAPSQLPNSSTPGKFQIIGDHVFFFTNLGICKTDGTPEGTVLLKSIENIRHGYGMSWFDYQFGSEPMAGKFGDKYFIHVENTLHGNELWISDGTEEGSYPLDIFRGGGSSLVRLKAFPTVTTDDYLYFEATDGIFGRELWRTDGTLEGSSIVKDINAGIKGSEILSLNTTDDKIFFIAQTEKRENTALYVFDKNAQLESPVIDNAGIELHKVIMMSNIYNNSDMENKDLALDNDENILILGQERSANTISFLRDDYWLPADDQDYYSVMKNFVVKYSPSGILQWVNYTHGDSYSRACLTTDNENNIITGGKMPDFWSGDDTEIHFFGTILDVSNEEAYVAKLDVNGNLLWSVFYNNSQEEILDIVTDEEQNVYVLARFSLKKFDENGNLVWQQELSPNVFQMSGVIQRYNQFIYITTSTSASDYSSYGVDDESLTVAKYGTDGSLIWKKVFSGMSFLSVNDFKFNPQGQLSIVGSYSRTLTAPPFSITTPFFETNPDHWVNPKHGFYLNMDRNGQVLFLKNDTLSSQTYGIAFNDKQQYYTINQIENSTHDRYEGFEEYFHFPSNNDILSIKKYDYKHRLLEERDFYSRNNTVQLKMELTDDDKILFSGRFFEQFDTLPHNDNNDEQSIQVLKLALNSAPSVVPTWELEENISVSISPNPSRGIVDVRVIDMNFINYDLYIFDAKGRTIDYFEKRDENEFVTYNFSNYQSGTYFLKFINGENEFIRKLIIVK